MSKTLQIPTGLFTLAEILVEAARGGVARVAVYEEKNNNKVN